ncbi:MAG: hypothetical protein ACYDDT_10365 [Sulfuricella sp.]
MNVSWNVSTDNVGVTYYQVYRNGSLAGTPAGPTNNFWPDNFVVPGTPYSYTVAACDAAGNCSAQSAAVSVTTPAGTGVSQFDGAYTGSWSKACPTCGITAASGTFTATLANGVLSNTQFTITSGDSGILFSSGTVSSSGAITGTGVPPSQCSSSVSTFTGQITTSSSGGAGMTMTYSRPASSGGCGAESGTLTATRTTTNSPALNLAPGWNLVGNGMSAPISASSAFGNSANVTTVWKWEPTGAKAGVTYPAWAFYTPMQTDGGAAYAASKGYDFLTTINPGEGFWVNSKSTFTAALSGSPVTTISFQDQLVPPNKLPAGWSLIAVGDNPTASGFNKNIGATPPATGVIPVNLTSMWAWDNATSNWYFYAPSLDSAGTLASYITTKSYLNFGTKPLDPTMGFWVNHP